MAPELIELFVKYIDVSGEDIEVVDFASQILTQVEDFIYHTYDISISPRTVTEYLNGSGGTRLYTSKGNITSVTLLEVFDEPLTLTSAILKRNSIYLPDNTFTYGVNNVKVTYVIGYAIHTDIPPSLLNAVFSVGKKMYTDITKNLENVSLISSDTKQSIKPLDRVSYLADTALQAFRVYKL